MREKLVVAIPSKGRLMEQSLEAFAAAGLPITRPADARGYRATMAGCQSVEVRLLSASEIAGSLRSGQIDIGITGDDLVAELAPSGDRRINRLKPLGFGAADVIVAVPCGWIDVSVMADLEEIAGDFHRSHGRWLRVATKYPGLTRHFFRQKGVSGYRIVESLGATEGAPAAGTAEIIVDITSTGATLAANQLKLLDDGLILRSEAAIYAAATSLNEAAALARASLLKRFGISPATP